MKLDETSVYVLFGKLCEVDFFCSNKVGILFADL